MMMINERRVMSDDEEINLEMNHIHTQHIQDTIQYNGAVEN